MFLVVRIHHKTVRHVSHNLRHIKEQLERLDSSLLVLVWAVSPISGIRLRLHWKLSTLDTPFAGTHVSCHVIWNTIRDVITYYVIKFAQSFRLFLKL